MMDHIRQHDWCASAPREHFITEEALDNSTIEKIIQNRFVDPLLSSDEETDEPNVIDWDSVFSNPTNKTPKLYVPCLRMLPPYPKISMLTFKHHHTILRVLCSRNPHVFPEHFIQKPTSFDIGSYETLKPLYEIEQKEFIEWAKSLWTNNHCIRALRPKPAIETVYEAEFKIRAQRLSGYPSLFDMAAQIPLECTRPYKYEAELIQTLKEISKAELPQVNLPDTITKDSTIARGFTIPEPCHKHPYQFILPNEDSVSILPITEIHRELAIYAAMNNTKFIASENALKCLVELNRQWMIPVTVCEAYTPDGESMNVVVLDSEFSIYKEPVITRTYKALKHLLEHHLIPTAQVEKMMAKRKNKTEKGKNNNSPSTSKWLFDDSDPSSDDEMSGLVISDNQDASSQNIENQETRNQDNKTQHTHVKTRARSMQDADPSYLDDEDTIVSPAQKKTESQDPCKSQNKKMAAGAISMEAINDIIGVYSCTCTDTRYEMPPRRSFKKWRFRNKNNTEDDVNVIVHCAHKARDDSAEVLLEPIPEYQLDLGASEQPPDKIRALALSLYLRENADVINVRVDGPTGDIARIDKLTKHEFLDTHPDKLHQVQNVVHTALSELQGLLPGHYLLQHEPSHGWNAFLHVARPHGGSITLDFDSSQLAEPDEAKMVKTPPTLTPVLLPCHKFRHTLPCAFTPFDKQVVKEQKKQPTKQRQPPQAIKWPKTKKGKKNKK